ncbi:MaoC family dehydratase N-terminal domain-containing protein [Thalassomonas sp. M1454]|uniref:MaoC family dehydratase N-terminal domain-containing protein n=1 Tax=Thalassomonas sp. M1454 TaxID=2594477 RepID=UPI00117ED108|nr:MaoC family dehydratase N-terminal domain-containing protein [Thalassomonas sp. M1454]TRX56524.1 MaoC family dehydratase [Thalassomonas sp. M1454]
MLDKTKVGHQFNPFVIDIEKGRLKFFAKAIGETNPIYFDEQAALEQGHRSILAPPTFPFTIELDGPELLPVLTLLDMDIGRVLHGSQEFEYFDNIYAGDQITVAVSIKTIFDKKGGALEFVVLESSFTNQAKTLVAKACNTLVYRN